MELARNGKISNDPIVTNAQAQNLLRRRRRRSPPMTVKGMANTVTAERIKTFWYYSSFTE